MPVFNSARYLAEAIDSILEQTFRDFEFIVINDGSTDESAQILQSIRDSRMVVLTNDGNKGLIYSLNLGVSIARGRFIARMDADDVSLKNRFQKQVHFLINNPECAVCGTWVRLMDAHGKLGQRWKRVTRADEVRAALFFQSPLIHPSVMGRTEIFKAHPYNAAAVHCEDYALWVELEELGCHLCNLGEVLLYYRVHGSNISVVQAETQRRHANEVIQRHLFAKLGIELTERELDLNRLWFAGGEELRSADFSWSELRRLGQKLLDRNAERSSVDQDTLQAILSFRWWVVSFKLRTLIRSGAPRMGVSKATVKWRLLELVSKMV